MNELAADVLGSLSTPGKVESRIGPLEFTDGAPARKTVETLYDHLDFVHGVNAFLTAFPAASTQAMRQGFHDIGVQDNQVLIFSELMDSSSRFLTANADTVYYISFIDLSDGPMVVETPPDGAGHVRRHVVPVDHRLRSPRAGPRCGRQVPARPARLRRPAPRGWLLRRPLAAPIGSSMLGRSFIQDDDPAPTVATIKSTTQDLPVHAGWGGDQRRHAPPRRRAALGPPAEVPATTFVEGSGLAFNTIPPTDARFFETVHALLQDEPADAGDPEIVGHLVELGIVKGKPFAPDDRMRKILEDAAAVGNATSRALMFDARGEEDVAWYPGLGVDQPAVPGRLPVRSPDPRGHAGGHQAVPAHRYPQARPAHPVLLRLHRDHARHGHAPHRHRQPVPRRLHGLEQGVLRRGEVVQRDACRRTSRKRGSGRSPSTTTRPGPCWSRPNASLAPAARPTRRRPRWRTRTARPPSTSAPSSPTASPTATGSRRCRTRGSSPSSACTARSQPFFDKSWQVGEIEPA